MKIHFNNYLFILFAVMLITCKTRQVSNQDETIRFDENSTDEIIADTQDVENVTSEVFPADTSVIDEGNKKDLYKVAVVFPFNEDSMRAAWNKAKKINFQSFKTSEESEISISFMEGMIISLKSLTLDSKFELTFYDDNNDDSRIDSIVEKIRNEEVDMIIGGLNKQNIVKLSSLAKTQDIMILSPFSPSKSAAAGNSKYYMFEPSLEQHFLSMVNYTLDSIEKPQIKFIYHQNPAGQFYARFISEYIDGLNDSLALDQKINFTLIETSVISFKLDENIESTANNVFIVNSFDESFIHTFLKQINKSNKTNEILAFGMPGWENSQTIRLEYMSNSNIHFTKSSWIDWGNPEVEVFSDTYKTLYGKNPNTSAFLGYDFANFIFKAVNDFGLDINKAVIGNLYNGLERNLKFEIKVDSNVQANRIENTNLRIYKIEDFEPILVR